MCASSLIASSPQLLRHAKVTADAVMLEERVVRIVRRADPGNVREAGSHLAADRTRLGYGCVVFPRTLDDR